MRSGRLRHVVGMHQIAFSASPLPISHAAPRNGASSRQGAHALYWPVGGPWCTPAREPGPEVCAPTSPCGFCIFLPSVVGHRQHRPRRSAGRWLLPPSAT